MLRMLAIPCDRHAAIAGHCAISLSSVGTNAAHWEGVLKVRLSRRTAGSPTQQATHTNITPYLYPHLSL